MDVKYKGMTVNERLYISGLSDDFYKAVNNKDVETAIEILQEVELNDQLIVPILRQLGLTKS